MDSRLDSDHDSGLPPRPPHHWETVPIDGPIRVEIDKQSVSFDDLRRGMHVHCTVITNGNGFTRIRLTA